MVNVHASGGRAMMKAAVAANAEAGDTAFDVGRYCVTSLDDDDQWNWGFCKCR